MKAITKCRSCKSTELTEFLDLGKQYLSDFREDHSKTPLYPLVLVFCEHCKLVQLKHTTPQLEMYHDRYGFKSGISDSIKKDLDSVVTHAFQYVNDPQSWLDIASNDGTLLSFVPEDIFRVGVDPVKFLCEEAEQHANNIVNKFFDSKDFVTHNNAMLTAEYQKFSVVTSISCFYDMPDPEKFVQDVKNVLHENGVWVIQQNYLLTTLELSAVDNVCHEHIEYYTLLSLENLLHRFGLEVNEVYLSGVNGGSIRTIVSHEGTFMIEHSVAEQRRREADFGLSNIRPYKEFAETVADELNKLRSLLIELKNQGKRTCILAASTRGATIWQSADINGDLVEYAVERNPAKVGRYFSAIGIPIISEEDFRLDQPDYALIGPWFFADEFVAREEAYLKAGGSLIKPLPKVEVITWPS